MKNHSLILIAVAAVLTAVTGCSKRESTETPAVESARPAPTASVSTTTPGSNLQDQATAARESADRAAAAAKEQATAASDAAAKAAAAAKDQATAVNETATNAAAETQAQAAAITSKAQQMLENVKTLIAQKDWSAASKQLAEISTMKLTPEQQATLASLKEQVQKLAGGAAASNVTDQAGKAVGNLLKK